LELVGDSNPDATEVGLGDLPRQRRNVRRCLVRGSAGGLLIFDLVEPAVQGGSSDSEIPRDLSTGDLKGLQMPEDEEPLADFIS
jgi:hypothetical protein